MLEAASLMQIKSKLSSNLPQRIIVRKRQPVTQIGFMTTLDISRPLKYQTVAVTEERTSKLIGILLCHPNSPLAKSEIIGHLNYFHHRSGEAIDFFCAGYGAYWPPYHYPDQSSIIEINGEKWLFSDVAFTNLINELESETSWKSSGETELVLFGVRKNSNGELEFQYDAGIACNLERMLQEGAFTSVRAFFDNIFKLARKNQETNSAWEFSDILNVNVLKSFIVSLLPEPLRLTYLQASHDALKNLSSISK